jgi:methyl-accepting chemotaxis protein
MNPFKVLESIILGPPRLVLRTLDDLHNLVEVGSDMNRRLGHIERATGDIVRQLDLLLEIARLLERSGETVVLAAKRVDAMARDVITLGDRIDAAPDAIRDVGARFEDLAGQIAEEGKILQERAKEVADRGSEMAAAIPFLRQAMELAAPLEGAMKGFGQAVEAATGQMFEAATGGSSKPRARATKQTTRAPGSPSAKPRPSEA